MMAYHHLDILYFKKYKDPTKPCTKLVWNSLNETNQQFPVKLSSYIFLLFFQVSQPKESLSANHIGVSRNWSFIGWVSFQKSPAS